MAALPEALDLGFAKSGQAGYYEQVFSIASPLHSAPPAPRRLLPSGFSRLDASGGFARGQLVEISGAASSGKSTLAFGACLQALAQGSSAAWIDSSGTFWPLPALEANVSLERLLVLRMLDSAAVLRSVQLILSCPGAVTALVVDVSPRLAIKDAQLVRLQRLAERSGTVLIFLTERPAQLPTLGAPIALRLHVRRLPGARFSEQSRLRIDVLRHKGGANQQSFEESVHGPNRLRVSSTL